MKDSKNSYEQMKWEHALSRHSRALKMISMLSLFGLLEERGEYWISVRDELEADYPILRSRN